MDEAKVAQLEARIAELEARLNKWALNGLRLADQRSVITGPSATNGEAITFARSDHTH
jgi:hypothetical protein